MPDHCDEKDNGFASSLPTFLLGLLLGFLSRPLIMGCFESKEAVPQPAPRAVPVKPVVAQAAPVPERVVAEQQVLSVPRAAVQVTDRDRAELKAKSLRDKLSTFVLQSDQQMRQDGLAALQAKRAGNLSTARVILHRRSLLRAKVDTAQARVETVMGMIAAMEDAKDNAKTFDAIEKGTAMINEVMQGMSKERVREVLDGSKEAEDRVREVNIMLGADGEMDQSDFEAEMAALEAEQPEVVKAAEEVAEVSAATPAAPVVGQPVAVEEVPAMPVPQAPAPAMPVAVTTEAAAVAPIAVADAPAPVMPEPAVAAEAAVLTPDVVSDAVADAPTPVTTGAAPPAVVRGAFTEPVITDAAPPAPVVVPGVVTEPLAPVAKVETALEKAENIPEVPTVVPDMPAAPPAADEEEETSGTDEKRLAAA